MSAQWPGSILRGGAVDFYKLRPYVDIPHKYMEGVSVVVHAPRGRILKYQYLGVTSPPKTTPVQSRLKRLVADLSLDKHMLSEALRKKV